MGMKGSRSIRSFRCADKLWRALEDEADERGVTVDTVITEALWSHLREAPEFSTAMNVRQRTDVMHAPRTDAAASDPLHQGLSQERKSQIEKEDRARTINNPKLAVPVRTIAPARAPRSDDSAPTVDNLKIIRDAQGRVVDPETGQAIDPENYAETSTTPAKRTKERPELALFFSGMRYPVEREKFLIGRASTGTDLQIRDANVSRKHAAVIYHDGGWFIHDLQSTNGVEFKGRHIRTRRIEHNDRFLICDYELIFELEA